ncbi:MAG: hypothetical protein AUJ31_01710 [Parcubacteria group bacterium CG1_02_39_15]|uniref:Uncharacterized protein n=4 Tax=Candidatus Nealsoniibacteriota TaxID=1817911 RepID=A0A2H0MP80_9BACT|nr:MAG: hypothetical protein AUJ31_01710 [Parcubacteria group bacterium CG1_02_39_15]PIQ98466.1 MAG: hypothetical protein COV64_01145 [Candidatus Nealsonbacteria bacterium CG11_big_fil_rev_8_21_14_0_20_39_9]PIW90375.1 MAG: hypothetical protein COZ92_00885 [Candidatus Nealsonbacteria bacterium CG_4_8_14_3_um_filter_40_11]PIZ87923.1 MAG: hypothetical protein COX91_03015 [Candidatus Nealsonbacteria bacterium CG_4_10_14_0_2_um_filter_39_15]
MSSKKEGEMAVGVTTKIKLTVETHKVLLHILQTHDSQNPTFQDLASRLMTNMSLVQEITKEETLTLLTQFKKEDSRYLPPEAEELLGILRKLANDFSRVV